MTIPNNRPDREFFPPTVRRRLLTGLPITRQDWERIKAFKGWYEDFYSIAVERDEGYIFLDRTLFAVDVTERASYVIQDITHLATGMKNRVEIPIAEFEDAQSMSAQEILDGNFCEQVLELRRFLGASFFFMPLKDSRETAAELLAMLGDASPFRNQEENDNLKAALQRAVTLNPRNPADIQAAMDRINQLVDEVKSEGLSREDDSKPAPKDKPTPFSLIELE